MSRYVLLLPRIHNELPPLLEKAEKYGLLIIPLILKPCRFDRENKLNIFQAINSPSEPLGLIEEVEREAFYDDVAKRIELSALS